MIIATIILGESRRGDVNMPGNLALRDTLIEILQEEVRPAVGCTEPGAIAYAAALAAEHCQGELVSIKTILSPGVFKNGYAVGIPGTGAKGIALAAALGASIGDGSKQLEILMKLSREQIQIGKEIVAQGLVSVNYDWDFDGIYIQVEVKTTEDVCVVVIRGGHTQVESIRLNEIDVFASQTHVKSLKYRTKLRSLGLEVLFQQAQLLPLESLGFLLEGLEQNYKIAEEGLAKKRGLGVGYGLNRLVGQGVMQRDLLSEVKILVAAAADARMEGVELPVSTSFGSGNQGILTSLGIGAVATYLEADQEQLARALAMGHLFNGYVKESIGKISPLCGCSVAAGLGVTAAVSWLLGNDWPTISGAMNSLLGNIAGMVCDGAKGGCAFKLATSAGESLTAALLATNDIMMKDSEGIVDENIEDSIKNLSRIGKVGMANLDRTMLGLMLERG